MSHATEHALDVNDFEVARSLHRIVRAMHDGECPKCHWLFESTMMRLPRVPEPAGVGDVPKSMVLHCPSCGFSITDEETKAVLDLFGPVMEKNLAVFEKWRSNK